MPHVKFVVLTTSRTGSSWLIDLLNLQAGVDAHGELFLDHGRLSPAIAGRADFPRFIEMYGTPLVTRIPRVFTYLNRLYGSSRTVGFKLMYTQLRRYPEILAYMAAKRVRVVHLTRVNLVDAIVSEELARLTGTSHIQTGTSSQVPAVRLDPATLLDRLHSRSKRPGQARLLIRLAASPVIEVTYEALLGEKREFARILDFLEVPGPLERGLSSLAKRGTRSHRDGIANYDEVRQILAATPFFGMLR